MTAPDLVSELREAFRVEPGETLHAQHPKYLGNLAADAIERLTRERDALLVESDGRKELLGRYKAERDAARAELAAARQSAPVVVTEDDAMVDRALTEWVGPGWQKFLNERTKASCRNGMRRALSAALAGEVG